MTETQRKRDYRRRQRCGLQALRIWTVQHDLAEALIASGRLTPGQCLCRADVERAAGEILHDWSRRWIDDRKMVD